MDTTGCPPGKFTDKILVYYYTPFSCDSDIATWLGLASTFVCFRVIILVLVWLSWAQQSKSRGTKAHGNVARPTTGQRNRQQDTGHSQQYNTAASATEATTTTTYAASGNRSARRRFPLIPVLSTLDTIAMAMIPLLASLNAVDGPSGTALLVLWMWLLQVCVIQFATLKKMVGLGFRILRFDQRYVTQSSNSKTAALIAGISNFDSILKVLMTLMLIILPTMYLLTIVGAIVQDHHGFAQASISLFAIQQAMLYSSMMYQYHRCIRCVKTMMHTSFMMDSSNNGGKEGAAADPKESEHIMMQRQFQTAIHKMRYQQFVMFLTGVCHCGLKVYFAITLRLYWEIVVFCLALDCFIYFTMVISFFPCFSAAKSSSASRAKSTAPSTTKSKKADNESEPGDRSRIVGGSSAFLNKQQGSSSRLLASQHQTASNSTRSIVIEQDLPESTTTMVLDFHKGSMAVIPSREMVNDEEAG